MIQLGHQFLRDNSLNHLSRCLFWTLDIAFKICLFRFLTTSRVYGSVIFYDSLIPLLEIMVTIAFSKVFILAVNKSIFSWQFTRRYVNGGWNFLRTQNIRTNRRISSYSETTINTINPLVTNREDPPPPTSSVPLSTFGEDPFPPLKPLSTFKEDPSSPLPTPKPYEDSPTPSPPTTSTFEETYSFSTTIQSL